MKTLYLIRHAKSSWKYPFLTDFERPLNPRGKQDRYTMAKRFQKMNIIPDKIFCSPAKRTKKTAKAFLKILDISKKDVIYDSEIYNADVSYLDILVGSFDDIWESVFLIGHHPGLADLVYRYTGFQEHFPTCGVCAIAFDITHRKDKNPVNASLLFFDYPKKRNE